MAHGAANIANLLVLQNNTPDRKKCGDLHERDISVIRNLPLSQGDSHPAFL
jgi:hypothetical protein